LRIEVSYYLYQKQHDKALARVNAQIEKSPKNPQFYDLLAELDAQDKKLDQAAAAAQKAVQLNSSDSEAVMVFAQIEVLRGQAATAIGAWQQWLSSHPNDANATAVLGTLEESSGDRQKAEADYKKALQLQPQLALAANNLAYLMLENGENVDVALSLAQSARQALPTSANTADTLAWAYYYKGTYGFARDLLEEAIKTEPNSPDLQYHLGMVYTKLRDKNNAQIHLKKAVALAPDSPAAKEARAALQGLG
jgi:Flp pilus assembly protein TadD